MITDTDRIDWLQKMQASVASVTSDEWEEGRVPEFLRFYVGVDGYKIGLTPYFGLATGEAHTLRDAIDAAMREFPA